MKVSAILKGKKDDLGRQNIVIRISDNQSRRFQKIGIKVKKDEFSKGLVKTTHSLHRAYNLKIKEEILKIERHGGFTTQEDGVPFEDYFNELLARWDKSKKPETLRQYRSELNKVTRYKANLTLQDFTPTFLQAYKEHCYSLGNSENTAWKTFKAIRVIILRAVKEGLLKENPFPVFEMPKYRDPKKIWLTESEINDIEKVRLLKNPGEIHHAATWFLIGCYSGLRYGDMYAFNKKEHIKQGRLILYTSKTGELVSLPFKERLKGLFESIQYKPLSYTNQAYNRLLKQVQGLAEIDTTITAHVSRHSAAVRWANHGVSQEVVAKLLGHEDLKTTAIYFKITNMRVDNELPL